MKVLILGGYGTFGGRLVQLLADLPELEMLIAGRSLPRAEAFCAAFDGVAQVRPLLLDRAAVGARLAGLGVTVVVDASGPFQDYGAARYGVVEACLAAGADYLDLADAADFVVGISAFDAQARASGRFILSGVSSFPVLSAAVVAQMSGTMEVTAVEGGVAPTPRAGIGLNVMRAVMATAGHAVPVWRNGARALVPGLTETRRFTIAVPGKLPLPRLRFALVDVPDLQVLPATFPRLRQVWMGAGTRPQSLHRLLVLAAQARAALRLPSFQPLAPLAHRVLNLFRRGEHRGGMVIRAQGVRDGKPAQQSWHLLAEGDNGPFIPSMAPEVILRGLLAGHRPEAGARSAAGALRLSDFDAPFARHGICHGFRTDEDDAAPLYRALLGSSFADLGTQVRRLHDHAGKRQWSGLAEVRRGQGAGARLVARIIGFPGAAKAVPVTVTLTPDAKGELWQRDFGGQHFASHQRAGTGKDEHLLVERFGLIEVALALVVGEGRLHLVPRHWRMLGVPLPRALLPGGDTFEADEEGAFRFDVEIRAPLFGLIVGYRGKLAAGAGHHGGKTAAGG